MRTNATVSHGVTTLFLSLSEVCWANASAPMMMIRSRSTCLLERFTMCRKPNRSSRIPASRISALALSISREKEACR